MGKVQADAGNAQQEAARIHGEGIQLARQHQFEEAAKRFARAAELDPTRLEAIRHLAQAQADAGQLDDAEQAWMRLVAANPNSADGFRQLGNLRKRMEKFDAAIDAMGWGRQAR